MKYPLAVLGLVAASVSLEAQAPTPAPVYVTLQLLSGPTSSFWGERPVLHDSKFLPGQFNADSVLNLASAQLQRAEIVEAKTPVPDGATLLTLTLYADTVNGSKGNVITYYLHAVASRGVTLSPLPLPEFVADPIWTAHLSGYVGIGKDEDAVNMRSGTGDLRLHKGPVVTAIRTRLLDLMNQFVLAYQRAK